MATSSRQSALFGVQDWQRIYQSYREADFTSFDYETLRKSFVDYLTTYYPETFNDYIESSEFVALLDVMAYMGQALAFRGDLNARENFIDTAERRDSVIKLANLVSYTPKRNIAGQGLVKITAISTTENVVDINGTNLSNTTILWNDPANANWQEQFNSILNAVLINNQRIGKPGNSQLLLGVKTEEYSMNIPAEQLPVVPYSTDVDGIAMSFELVSATSANRDYLYEIPPAPSGQFNVLYRNDKLGYGSANTGFFFYFKQGTLQNTDFAFPEQIENNFQNIDVQGINNTDTWLYQLNSEGTIDNRWAQVDNVYINSNLQGQSARRVFSVTSRTNDQVTYIFGDGVFGEVPVGLYRAYVRSGNALTYTIDPTEMQGIAVNLSYISRVGKTETLTFTVSLQSATSTAQQREGLAQIKERAPARYYTQNRMVNGEDYSNFPYTLYSSIIKSKAINRSSIGVSRNLDLLDPTGKYSSTNVFADDGALYVRNIDTYASFSTLSINFAIEFLSLTLPVYLSLPATIQYYQKNCVRYTGKYAGTESTNGKCYWKRLTVTDSNVSGYFYVKNSLGTEIPITVGAASTYTMRFITKGAQVKFIPPTSLQYFDINNRLKTGTPNAALGDKTFIWIGVDQVIGDGDNGGEGAFSDGSGPITLNQFIPSEAIIDDTVPSMLTPEYGAGIIPVLDNTLGSVLVREMLDKIELKQNFSVYYNNGLPESQDRWTITPVNVDTELLLITFQYSSIDGSYTVYIKNVSYYFGSVSEVRFYFDTAKKVFDSVTGQTINDFVDVLKTNANSSGTSILGNDYYLNITGQQIESDGYSDDYAVLVTSLDNNGISYNPDFFSSIVGDASTAYVFFKVFTDINDLYRTQILPPGTINYNFNLQANIAQNMYDYPAGTVFYAKFGNGGSPAIPKFYQSQVVTGTVPPILELADVTTEYDVTTGRAGVYFQYRHNSNNTTRIDPATTNIIDLYLVTQSYYTSYQNWLVDTTGTVPMPAMPTIDQLEQSYNGVDSYKMISDSVVLNSVVFKPLFGTKAPAALQGKIKVIKSATTTVSDTQIRSSVLAALNSYFTIDKWDFGDTFYFSELTAYLHVQLAGFISSVVLVSNDPNQTFGDLYEIRSEPNEIFVNGATSNDVIVISALTPASLQR